MGRRNRAVSKQDAFKAFQEACAGSLIPISSFIPSNFLLPPYYIRPYRDRRWWWEKLRKLEMGGRGTGRVMRVLSVTSSAGAQVWVKALRCLSSSPNSSSSPSQQNWLELSRPQELRVTPARGRARNTHRQASLAGGEKRTEKLRVFSASQRLVPAVLCR